MQETCNGTLKQYTVLYIGTQHFPTTGNKIVHVTQSEKKGRNDSKLKEKGYSVLQNHCKIIPEAFLDPFKIPARCPQIVQEAPRRPKRHLRCARETPKKRLRVAPERPRGVQETILEFQTLPKSNSDGAWKPFGRLFGTFFS